MAALRLQFTCRAYTSTQSVRKSVRVDWTDPNPQASTYYNVEWSRQGVVAGYITATYPTTVTFFVRADVGEEIRVRVRGVYFSPGTALIEGEWSDWSNAWVVLGPVPYATLIVANRQVSFSASIVTTTPTGVLRVIKKPKFQPAVVSVTSTPSLIVNHRFFNTWAIVSNTPSTAVLFPKPATPVSMSMAVVTATPDNINLVVKRSFRSIIPIATDCPNIVLVVDRPVSLAWSISSVTNNAVLYLSELVPIRLQLSMGVMTTASAVNLLQTPSELALVARMMDMRVRLSIQ